MHNPGDSGDADAPSPDMEAEDDIINDAISASIDSWIISGLGRSPSERMAEVPDGPEGLLPVPQDDIDAAISESIDSWVISGLRRSPSERLAERLAEIPDGPEALVAVPHTAAQIVKILDEIGLWKIGSDEISDSEDSGSVDWISGLRRSPSQRMAEVPDGPAALLPAPSPPLPSGVLATKVLEHEDTDVTDVSGVDPISGLPRSHSQRQAEVSDGPANLLALRALLAGPHTAAQGPSANLISITDNATSQLRLPVIPFIPGNVGIQIDSSLPIPRSDSSARRLITQSSQKMDKCLFAVMKIFHRIGGAGHVAKQAEYIQKTLHPIMQPLLENLLVVLPAEPLLFVVIWLRQHLCLEVDVETCARAGRSKYRDLQDKLTAQQEAHGSVDDDKATLRAVYKMYIEDELNPLIEGMTSSCVCQMPPDAAQFLLDFVERKLAEEDAPGVPSGKC